MSENAAVTETFPLVHSVVLGVTSVISGFVLSMFDITRLAVALFPALSIARNSTVALLLTTTPLANCVFNVSNNHIVPMDDILMRLEKIDGKPLEYVEDEVFAKRMEAAQADPAKAQILAPLVAYQQSSSEQQGVETLASTVFTMQVLHRLGFRWNHTSSEYVDMVFEMLRTLRFFEE